MAEAAEETDRRGRGLLVVFYALGFAAAAAVCLGVRTRSSLVTVGLADLAATAVVFIGSIVGNNSSVYDPYWSVAPIPIALYWAWGGVGVPWLRRGVVVSLVVIWGARLTYNCLARWRGLRHEDFRYAELRGRAGRLYWPLSFVGIHLMPTVWVFLGLLPVYFALHEGPGRPLGWLDAVAVLVTATAIGIESIADHELRGFLRSRRDPKAVLVKGLWSLSRHPNYFGEVLFWWGLYLFGLAAHPEAVWTGIGAVSITLLFLLVSIPWMDRRMASRHPGWREQMQHRSGLVPWSRRSG
jgi:steroid 5-alpha reductase family enzyme